MGILWVHTGAIGCVGLIGSGLQHLEIRNFIFCFNSGVAVYKSVFAHVCDVKRVGMAIIL